MNGCCRGQRECALLGILTLISGLGCHQDMRNQPRYEVFEASDFFADGQSARPLVAGTVARGQLLEDEGFNTGSVNGELLARVPVDVDQQLLARGRERFEIFCSMCHAPTGTGDGMIVQRGYRRPPSFHTPRLRDIPDGHIFDVITRGIGVMPGYGKQIPPRDRWAIVAYIRALQLSQNATLEDVPADVQDHLRETRS